MSTTRKSIFRTSPLAFAGALLALAGAAWAASSVTAPGAVANTEGNFDNLYPFNGAPIRYQQVFSASEFSGGAGWINQILLRPDAANGGPFTETLSNIQINLSTTSTAPATISKTFSANVGSNDTVVFSGALPLSSAYTGPSGGPMDFDIVITLQTPFYYDSTTGNLLLDVRNYGGGKTTQFDAQDAPDSTARVWSLDVNSTTAVSSDPFPSAGLVARFMFQ